MKVAIVAGEKSGDYLGKELIQEIQRRHPGSEFIGICGPLMQQQGGKSLADMDKLSIFGLEGVFSSLFELLKIRKNLYNYFIQWQPDVFVGIDAPDFNLRLERKLKAQGIPAVHYVSPSVWAWRGGRINKIQKSIDLMLTLFPFEESYYQQHNMPVRYVGHSLAQQIIDWQVDQKFINDNGFQDQQIIAVLPGSRMSEVTRLAPVMMQAVSLLAQQYPDYKFVIPAANKMIFDYFTANYTYDTNIIQVVEGHSRDVLALCKIAILASGTAALEAAMFAKPMIVMYKVSWLSAAMYKHTITVDHYSLPNHLTNSPVVPELIQTEVTTENLFSEASKFLSNPDYYKEVQSALAEIAPRLCEDSAVLACNAIDELLANKAASLQ